MTDAAPRRLSALLRREASTRSAALLRICLVLLLWARFAESLTLPRTPSVALSAAFFAATALLLVGLWTRLAAAATAATMLALYFGFGVAQGVHAWVHHHHYLLVVAALLVALTPCGRSYALDRWLELRAGRPAPERGPAWALRLVTLQLAAIYLWSAYDKTSAAFLSGARLEQIGMYYYWGSDPPSSPGFHACAAIAASLVVLLEAALGLMFLSGRTARWLLAAGALLHALLYVSLPVGTFSATMIALYLAALDPDAVHRALDRLAGRPAG